MAFLMVRFIQHFVCSSHKLLSKASIYDIRLTHGMRTQSDYDAIHGVLNAPHKSQSLKFKCGIGIIFTVLQHELS